MVPAKSTKYGWKDINFSYWINNHICLIIFSTFNLENVALSPEKVANKTRNLSIGEDEVHQMYGRAASPPRGKKFIDFWAYFGYFCHIEIDQLWQNPYPFSHGYCQQIIISHNVCVNHESNLLNTVTALSPDGVTLLFVNTLSNNSTFSRPFWGAKTSSNVCIYVKEHQRWQNWCNNQQRNVCLRPISCL